MRIFELAILLSLGAGGLYACLSQGLLLTYRSSGVVNFAYGAVAMYGAYIYSALRDTGRYVLPPIPNLPGLVIWTLNAFGAQIEVPSMPDYVFVPGSTNPWIAGGLTVLTGVAIGLLMHVLVFRPMRLQPPLGKLVASLGIMLTLQAIVILRFGVDPHPVKGFLPLTSVSLLDVSVPIDRFIIAALAVVITLGLAAMYRYTRLGWMTEAVADSPKGAVLSGLPSDLVAGTNWVISAVAAVVMGMLLAPISGLTPTNFSLYVLPALAALLVARMRSFLVAAAASFAIAALEAATLPILAEHPELPAGLPEVIPLAVLLVTMLVFGKTLPGREESSAEQLPAAPKPERVAPAVWSLMALSLVACFVLPYDFRGALITTLATVPVAISLVILVGLVGQLSLMQLTVAGVAAFTMSRIGWIGFPAAPILAALVAVAAGLITALPALRLRGTHLAMVTLAAAAAFSAAILNDPRLLGANPIPSPSLFGFGFGINDRSPIGPWSTPNPMFGVVLLFVAFASVLTLRNLRKGSIGRRLLAVRSNERAAASAGISVPGTKILAFAISGLFAGLGGAMSAYQFNGVSPTSFDTFACLGILAIVYLGGISRLSGSLIAAALVTGGLLAILPMKLTASSPQYYNLVVSLGLVLTAVLNPQGIAGAVAEQAAYVRQTVPGWFRGASEAFRAER